MRLIGTKIIGFQSFRDSGAIEFSAGFNLIIGQNNAGKSALLRALQPRLTDDRHRSPERWKQFELPSPNVQLTIEIDGRELRSALLAASTTFIPVPPAITSPETFLTELLSRDKIVSSVTSSPQGGFSAPYPSHGIFKLGSGQNATGLRVKSMEGRLRVDRFSTADDNFAYLLHTLWEKNSFYFSAERMTLGESNASHAERITHNASNLPAVLLTLGGDRGDIFKKLVEHLRSIFPTIGNVSVRPKPEGNIEVRVWPTEAMERVELSFPLNSSGTGVSQVIALLTAIMTIDNAVIIIDEINSFLHPAAVKALLRILQTEYSQHQYIISTHAPEVISFSNSQSIHWVKRSGYESTVTRLDLGKVATFRDVAEHLGVSMADVFAAEKVIWVEGQTEELCFPYIYQTASSAPLPQGLIFTAVMATGDFTTKRRDRALIYEIYRRLSSATSVLAISLRFSFDRENTTDSEREEMVRESRGQVRFLPRRHLECYLVNADAIAELIRIKDPSLVATASSSAINTLLAELASRKPFLIPEWKGDLESEDWLSRVDAANLIAAVVGELSGERVVFNKKLDTLILLKFLLANDRNRVASLIHYVLNLADSTGVCAGSRSVIP